MEFLTQLWMPIVVSAGVVFILSALAWTAMPHHKHEWQPLPNEDAVLNAMRASQPPPGQYTLPFYMDPKERDNPVVRDKLMKGPVGFLTIVPNGIWSMAPMMGKAFVYNLVVSFLVAYVGWHALGAGASYLAVFRVVGAVAAMSYVLAVVPESIWFGRPWKTFRLHLLDGTIYGLFTAGVFGWLWPS
ncbi:MAG TPA: hypothetical protein VF981_07510 [Gemmatimonadaceae bacterium]